PQLMRQVGEKFSAYAFEFLQLRDVEKDANSEIFAERRRVELKATQFKISHLNAHLDLIAVFKTATKGFIDCRVSGNFDEPLKGRRRIGVNQVKRDRNQVVAAGILLIRFSSSSWWPLCGQFDNARRRLIIEQNFHLPVNNQNALMHSRQNTR